MIHINIYDVNLIREVILDLTLSVVHSSQWEIVKFSLKQLMFLIFVYNFENFLAEAALAAYRLLHSGLKSRSLHYLKDNLTKRKIPTLWKVSLDGEWFNLHDVRSEGLPTDQIMANRDILDLSTVSTKSTFSSVYISELSSL